MMKYRISLRHSAAPEGTTFEEIFNSFDEAWQRAKILVDPMVDEEAVLELKFSRVE